MNRIAVAFAVAAVAFPQPASAQVGEVAKFVGVELLKGIGSKLTSEGLDLLWGKDTAPDQRIAELRGRLESYESGLRQVDAKSADQIALLRKDLSAKTTADDVRKIVNQTLVSLETRTGQLENRQDALDSRVRELESLFGYISTVPPAPLLTSTTTGSVKPTAHPAMAEWINLLIRSEESRSKIDELRRTRPDTSKVLQQALAEDKKLRDQSEALHAKVMKELAGKLPERQALLAEYKPGTPEVRQFDEGLASVTWLAAVTRPLKDGPYAGRLAVPQALFGFDSPEILRAFQLAKVDDSQIRQLFRHYAASLATDKTFLGIQYDSRFSAKQLDVTREIAQYVLEGIRITKTIPDLDARLAKTLASFANDSPEVQALLEEQRTTAKQLRELHGKLDVLLNTACEAYVEVSNTERPTTSRQTAFREGVLLPAAAWVRSLATTTTDGIDAAAWKRWSALRWELTLEGEKVAISPDGKWIVAGGHKKTKVWDIETGKERFTIEAGIYGNLAISPDGKWFAAGGYWKGGGAKVWDSETGRERFTLNQKEDVVHSVAISPDGKWIVTGIGKTIAKVWDAETGKERVSFYGHNDYVSSVAFGPDSKWIVSCGGSKDKTVRSWDAETGTERFALQFEYSFDRVAISPDGKWIAANGFSTTVWDAETRKERLKINEAGWLVKYSPDGKWIVTGDSHGKAAKVWDAVTGKERFTLPSHQDYLHHAAISPDGKWIATGSNDETVKVWNLAEPFTRETAEKLKK